MQSANENCEYFFYIEENFFVECVRNSHKDYFRDVHKEFQPNRIIRHYCRNDFVFHKCILESRFTFAREKCEF